MMKSRFAFTIMELLVVICILSVLVALFITLVPELRLRAKLADTKVRMQAVHTGLAQLGQNEGSATYVIQKQTEYKTGDLEPGLGGIMTFGKPVEVDIGGGVKEFLPTIGKKPPPNSAQDNGAWGKRGHSHLAFPWGKKFPQKQAGNDIMIGPEKFRLRDMSPFNTRKMLLLANILPTRTGLKSYSTDEYMTNRKESEPWNDRWGHPIVVSAVLYQPTYINDTNLPDGLIQGAWPADNSATPISPGTYMPSSDILARKALLDHLKIYQYNRTVYVAVAAVGPTARIDEALLKSSSVTDWANSPTTPTVGNLKVLWDQANWVCQQAKEKEYDQDWTELSFDNPPWQGIKDGHKNRSKHMRDANKGLDTTYNEREEHSLLSAPLEYR